MLQAKRMKLNHVACCQARPIQSFVLRCQPTAFLQFRFCFKRSLGLQISLIKKAYLPQKRQLIKQRSRDYNICLNAIMVLQACSNLISWVSSPFFDKKMAKFCQKRESLGARFKLHIGKQDIIELDQNGYAAHKVSLTQIDIGNILRCHELSLLPKFVCTCSYRTKSNVRECLFGT